jgi:hypothetical protein
LEKLEIYSNDMELLGGLLKSSKSYYSLPTEASISLIHDKLLWEHESVEIVGGIFDAAAIGQFLFGIDPRNCKGFLYNGFENENKGFDLWKLRYLVDLESGKASVSQSDGSNKTNLYNIHVHSKLFNQLLTDGRINEIIDKIHNGEKTIMSLNLLQNRLVRLSLKLLGFST